MSFEDFFLDPTKQVTKRQYKIQEDDLEYLKEVFWEHGFLTYFPGLMCHLLVEELKRRGIKDYEDRARSGTTIRELMPNYEFNRDSSDGDE